MKEYQRLGKDDYIHPESAKELALCVLKVSILDLFNAKRRRIIGTKSYVDAYGNYVGKPSIMYRQVYRWVMSNDVAPLEKPGFTYRYACDVTGICPYKFREEYVSEISRAETIEELDKIGEYLQLKGIYG